MAIVGATGLVGETMRRILQQRQFPVSQLFLLASERSAGQQYTFCQQTVEITQLAKFDFQQVDIALFSAGSHVSAEYAPKAAKAGSIVIDNSSHFRYDDNVPLIIPEVNGHLLNDFIADKSNYIIANPNCSTIQMLVALKPIYDVVGITRINICTYQAVSGSGKSAVQELQQQITAWQQNNPLSNKVYSKPIAFNVLPHIDAFQDNGYTREEMKMVWETRKILEDDAIQINPTAVRVPVITGHSLAIHIETHDKITAQQAGSLLQQAPAINVMLNDYPTPLTHAAGNNAVYVGRIREDLFHPNGLNLWVVADNIRKGAALNAIQIAEYLSTKI